MGRRDLARVVSGARSGRSHAWRGWIERRSAAWPAEQNPQGGHRLGGARGPPRPPALPPAAPTASARVCGEWIEQQLTLGRYFEQATRHVDDRGLVQVQRSYYAGHAGGTAQRGDGAHLRARHRDPRCHRRAAAPPPALESPGTLRHAARGPDLQPLARDRATARQGQEDRAARRAPRPADLRAPERKDLEDFDWAYNPKIPKREILGLSTLAFIEAREDALLIGPPGLGKSHIAKSLTQLAVQRGYKVLYREAHVLIDDIHQARELGALLKYRSRRPPS
jgi:hypothetical protein